jgi:RimJ/RimL family protein N-acetyltransferase
VSSASSSSPFSPSLDLTTARLTLRPWSPHEVATVLADDGRLAHWAEDFPSEGDRAIAEFIIGNHEAGLAPYGQRQIIERDSDSDSDGDGGGHVVGSIGLFWPPTDGFVEFGYGIVPSRRGRGYATEAARATVALAFTSPDVHTVHAGAELTNPASIRVLEKAGLTHWNDDGRIARLGVARRDWHWHWHG